MPKGCEHSEYALNHVTAPRLSWRELIDVASEVGASGVELRTDLGRPIFGDGTAEDVAREMQTNGIELLALAEVSGFNDGSDRVLAETTALADLARRSGAKAVIFIPRVGGDPVDFDTLTSTLRSVKPILDRVGVRGLIEPIGFRASTLRDFAVARRAIDDVDSGETFGIVHDTFHHYLSGGGVPSERYVELIHISGVTSGIPCSQMTDADRGLVSADDALGSKAQLKSLRNAGCMAPASFEAFSPNVQSIEAPASALRASLDFIETSDAGAFAQAVSVSETAPTGVPV